jgi:hypothetical protein
LIEFELLLTALVVMIFIWLRGIGTNETSGLDLYPFTPTFSVDNVGFDSRLPPSDDM